MSVLFTLKHLKYFLSVVEHQHFGKAAQANFVTQPTLSAAIREFEEILGLQLLERTKRKVLVTPAGHEIAEHACDILARARDLDDLCRAKSTPLSGQIRLGVIPTIAPFLLPKIMPSLRANFPDLTLLLQEHQSAVLVKEIEEGRLDLAILALPYDLTDMESFIFNEDPFYLAVQKDHPLAQSPNVNEQDLQKLDLLLLQEGHCLRDHVLNACLIKTVRQSVDFGATSLHTLIEMVASNLGVTLLPKMAIETDLVRNSSVQTIALSEQLPDRKIALIWRKTSGMKADFMELGTFLKSCDIT